MMMRIVTFTSIAVAFIALAIAIAALLVGQNARGSLDNMETTLQAQDPRVDDLTDIISDTVGKQQELNAAVERLQTRAATMPSQPPAIRPTIAIPAGQPAPAPTATPALSPTAAPAPTTAPAPQPTAVPDQPSPTDAPAPSPATSGDDNPLVDCLRQAFPNMTQENVAATAAAMTENPGYIQALKECQESLTPATPEATPAS